MIRDEGPDAELESGNLPALLVDSGVASCVINLLARIRELESEIASLKKMEAGVEPATCEPSMSAALPLSYSTISRR